jgi:hypothetical protein
VTGKQYRPIWDELTPRQKELELERRQKNLRAQLARYGLTKDELKFLLERSGGKCEICRRDISSKPNIDHDHDTGAVRGLLCSSCNTGLGLFRDSPTLMLAAITYLQENGR